MAARLPFPPYRTGQKSDLTQFHVATALMVYPAMDESRPANGWTAPARHAAPPRAAAPGRAAAPRRRPRHAGHNVHNRHPPP